MLKPGGVFVLTVPYGAQRETVEHFPELNEFGLVERDGSFVLRTKQGQGVVQQFNDLVFHGCPGPTLEMRVFSKTAVIQHLTNVGFAEIKVHSTPDLAHGICRPEPWSSSHPGKEPRIQASS